MRLIGIRRISPTAVAVVAVIIGSFGQADAAVYCKTVGVPQGCVVRAPVARAAVVTPGAGARGAGVHHGHRVHHGHAGNRGGGVNRVGRH